MTDKKFQIFISSTYKDLKKYRKAIIDQILISGNIPSGMESFVAGDDQDLQVIQKAIDQCDIYVVLIGSSYGSTLIESDGSITSYTKKEFEYAKSVGKPILAFLMADEQFKAERDLIKSDDNERAHQSDLEKFREEVKYIQKDTRRIVGFFGEKLGGIGGLRASFQNSLHELINLKELEMLGWVRGYDCERTRLPEVIDKNTFIRDIVEKLSEFDTLSTRCTEKNPDIKIAISQYFWYRYLPKLLHLKVDNIFFGSGSTIVYLSHVFSEILAEHQSHDYRLRCKIITNNILTYLHFVLNTNVDIDLWPYGPPEPKYGATFGEITRLPKWPPPSNDDHFGLKKDAKIVIDKMQNKFFSSDSEAIILITASGLVLDDGSSFQGPHVGSYYNKIFKRTLLEKSNHPVVLFLDATKFNEPFIEQKCHSVCDEDLPWRDICKNRPLAICFGCRSDIERDKIISTCQKYGLSEIDPLNGSQEIYPAIVKNKLFHERFIIKDIG